MNLIKTYNYLSEERIKMIKDLGDIEQELGRKETELNKLKREQASEYDIETVEKLIEMFEKDGNELRELLDMYFEAAEAIRVIINLRKFMRSKEFNPWQLFLPQNDKFIGPAIKGYIYGKE